MSIALVTTAGFGNGTLAGTVKGVVLRGYDIGIFVTITGGTSFFGLISDNGQGVSGIVNNDGRGLIAEVTTSFGVSAIIGSDGTGQSGDIS